MNKEFLEPYNKKLLEQTLERIKPNTISSFELTQKNRNLLTKYYTHMLNEGIAITRQRLVLGVLGRLFVMLNKDFETATKEDIEKLVTQIRQKDISPVTQCDYLKKLKQFDKWFNGGEEATERTRKIKTSLGKKHYKLPSQLITPKEAEDLINATDNIRDRALIHLMWESGARIGEIINCNMNSIQFDKGEARIRLFGKVGERQVLLLESVRDLKEFIKTRSNAKQDDPLFCLFGKYKGKPINHAQINKMLISTLKKTSIKKHIHAYLFRHSRASYLASQGLNEAQLCTIFGWTIGSKQPATYIHLSGSQTEDAYKRLYGIKKPEETEKQLIKCQMCGEVNPSKQDTCNNCYNPLSIQGALKIKQENDELVKASKFISELNGIAFKFVEQGRSIAEAKVLAMQELVEKEAEERNNKIKVLA